MIKKFINLISFALPVMLLAQSPGGVSAPDFWVKSDDAGNIATAWKDHSANADDIPAVGTWALSPADRAHNFYPYTTGYSTTKNFYNPNTLLNPGGGTNRTSYVIFSAVRPTAYTTGRITGIGTNGGAGYGSNPSIAMRVVSGSGYPNFYEYASTATSKEFSTPFVLNASSVFSSSATNSIANGGASAFSGGEIRLGLNGIYETTTYSNTNQFQFDGPNLRIGYSTYGDGAGVFSGDIMEVIWYKRLLTPDEQSRVNTYLAIKNGVTSAENYIAANNTVVWDRTLNNGYNNNVFGIARDDASALYQKQAASTNPNQNLIIGAGPTLFDSNAANNNAVLDNQFLLVGDNGLAQSLTTPLSYTAGSNGPVNFRFGAVWKAQNTNRGTSGITLAWPKGIQNLYLVKSSDPTFATGNSYFPMAAEMTVNGVVYNTVNISLADGQYFTLAGFAQAPGGVLDNLGLWTKADSGFTTALWTDSSLNEHHLTQTTTSLQPSLEPAGNKFNFNPSVNFDSDVMENTQVANQGNNSMSLYSVASLESSASSAATLIGIGASGNNPHFGAYPTGRFMIYPSLYNNAANPEIALSSVNLMSGHWQHATAGATRIEYNGFTARSGGNTSAPAGNFVVGTAAVNSTSEPWVGFVPEVIAYNQPKSGNENQRINSYLGIKYGLTLRTGGLTTGTFDYLSSASVTVWNGAANATYHNNVFGIARDNTSALYQKQSRSVNPGQRLIIGAGTSLVNTNADNTNALADGQFLLTGDNGLSQGLKVPFIYTSGTNGEANFRFESVWKVQNTNNVGTVTVAWPKGIQNLYLVQSSDQTFASGNTFTPMTTEVTINGVVYNTTTATLADGQFFTFAGYLYAPGGVTSAAWYRADAVNTLFSDAGTTIAADNTTIQQWNEFNNKPFPLSQSTVGYRPQFSNTTTLVNFNPTVTYTGGEKWLQYDPVDSDDTTEHCVKVYGGDPAKWSDCMGDPLPVITFNCAAATFSPASATVNQPYNGSLSIPYTQGNGGAYSADSFTAGELTFNLPAGNFATGTGSLTYQITGTPTSSGTISVDINQNGASCTGLLLPVNSSTPTNPAGTGSLSGRTCFDVVEIIDGGECGTLASRLPQKAEFSQTATNTQTYTFTPSGTVSNVRFVYVNTNGQVIQSLTGGNSGNNITAPVTATVKYYDNLNAAAAGLSRDAAMLADIYVIYNDSANNTGADRQLQLTARVQDCSCCGAYVAPGVWKNFMCHNLGADITADPFTPSWKLNGAYIQWGKRGPNITGDSSIDWQTAPNNGPLGFAAAPTASDPNAGGVSGWAGMDYSTNAWNSGTPTAPVKTAKDPCPVGFRVPTDTELDGLIRNNTITYKGTLSDSPTNYGYGIMFGSSLYIPVAGIRQNFSPYELGGRGRSIGVWTSTSGNYYTGGSTYNNQAFTLKSAGSNSTTNISGLEVAARGPWGGVGKDYGRSVRCIEE